jgi:hypothetical protein
MAKPPRPNSITPPDKPIEEILAGLVDPAAAGAPGAPPKKLPSLTAGCLRPDYIPLAESVAPDKHASYRGTLCWVFDNAGTNPADIDKTKIPSRGAVKLLDFVQQSLLNYTKFLDMHAKAVSDKSIAEAASQAEYDERRQTTLLNGILDRFKSDGARPEQNDPPSESVQRS